MIPLWDFQHETLDLVRMQFRMQKRAVLLVSPTGSGKTVMFCAMAKNHLRIGGRVLILVHRQELTQQVSDTLKQFEVEHGFIAAGFPDIQHDVNIGSVFTVARRLNTLPWTPTLIIVDEAHHAIGATTWGQILSHWSHTHVLGVTATPIRLSGEGLGESFEVMVQGPQTQELIDRRYLSRVRAFCPNTPDLSGVRKRAGDYVNNELVARVDRPSITGSAVEHYQRHCGGRQAVAFCASVEHAHHVASDFLKAGYQAASIDGSMPTEWRRQMIADFRERRLKVLTSCDLISEGFDCPGIEVGILLRPSQSLGLVRQQIGRTLRIAPDKTEALIFDHAGNIERHNLLGYDRAADRLVITEPAWSLNGRTSSCSDSEGGSSVRVCPKCWAAMSSHSRQCLNCQFVFPVVARQVAKKKGELKEMTTEELQAKLQASLRAQEVGQTDSLNALIELGKRRGYRDPEAWAKHVWAGKLAKKARFAAQEQESFQSRARKSGRQRDLW